MMIDEIKKLPVKDIADKDCMLFLWGTFPTFLQAFEVIEAWGFQYKTVAFVWIKQNKKSDSLFWGMGYLKVFIKSLFLIFKNTVKSQMK